jgi:hypothetical protein
MQGEVWRAHVRVAHLVQSPPILQNFIEFLFGFFFFFFLKSLHNLVTALAKRTRLEWTCLLSWTTQPRPRSSLLQRA